MKAIMEILQAMKMISTTKVVSYSQLNQVLSATATRWMKATDFTKIPRTGPSLKRKLVQWVVATKATQKAVSASARTPLGIGIGVYVTAMAKAQRNIRNEMKQHVELHKKLELEAEKNKLEIANVKAQEAGEQQKARIAELLAENEALRKSMIVSEEKASEIAARFKDQTEEVEKARKDLDRVKGEIAEYKKQEQEWGVMKYISSFFK